MLLAPSVAVAQDRAIPEPDSPAGVEYQLPLDRAREEASDPRDRDAPGDGGSERDRGGSGPAPLFGTGISPRGQDSANADSQSGGGPNNPDAGRRAGGDRADRGSGGSTGEASEADGEPSLGPTSASAASGSSDLALPGIALGVLLIGGLLGLALRRGMGPGREA